MNPSLPGESHTHTRLLLLDIGNTHCHAALASPEHLLAQADIPTADVLDGKASKAFQRLLGGTQCNGAVLCSVVPRATRTASALIREQIKRRPLILTHITVRGVGLDYPRPDTIGPDRLANAIAARHYYKGPVVVVDFGTAVTFDIVDSKGRYVGGIIAPGLAAMTDYLHEKTALLPRIQIREVSSLIGKSTEEAMLAGAVHGYRGLVRELIAGLKRELKAKRLPVIATGGYAQLIAQGMKEISDVRPNLTLEGLRLLWLEHGRRKAPVLRRN